MYAPTPSAPKFKFCARVSDPFVAVSLVCGFIVQGEVDRGRHQALLCAVVEIALEFAALTLRCAREPCARVGKFARGRLPRRFELGVSCAKERGRAGRLESSGSSASWLSWTMGRRSISIDFRQYLAGLGEFEHGSVVPPGPIAGAGSPDPEPAPIHSKPANCRQSPLSDSNRRPLPYHGSALPAELRGRSPRSLARWREGSER